jgi:hypothetical protein
MFCGPAPVLPYLGRAPLKKEGAKMVTRLINACHPLLIKGEARRVAPSNKRRRALANAQRLFKARLR